MVHCSMLIEVKEEYVWWWKNNPLELFCDLRAWTACHNLQKNNAHIYAAIVQDDVRPALRWQTHWFTKLMQQEKYPITLNVKKSTEEML